MRELPNLFTAITCYIGVLLVGFEGGYVSPTANSLVELTPLTANTLPLFAGMIFLGSLVMLPILSFTSQTTSTKSLLIISTVPGCIGWLTAVIADDVYTMLIGRFLLGVQTSALFLTSVYMGETAAPRRRRLYCSGISLAKRSGIVLIYAFGIWVPFRWLAVIAIVIEVIFLCLMLWNPISPVWLLQQGLENRTKECLEYLHGKQFDADSEIMEMKRNNIARLSIREKLSQLFKWKVLKPIIVVGTINNLSPLGGNSFVVMYSSQILSHQRALSPNIAVMFYPIMLLVGNVIGQQLVSRFSLKRIMLIASSLIILSHISMTLYFATIDYISNCTNSAEFAVASICLHSSFWPIINLILLGISYGMGPDCVIYAILGEAFDSNNRELSLCIIHTVGTILSIIVVVFFQYIFVLVGGTLTFGIFSIIMLSYLPLEYYLIKE